MLKTYFELHLSSPGVAMELEEIDDNVTKGIIAHEFAELIAREKGIYNHETIDEICVEKGFGWELLLALKSILPGRVERAFIDGEDLERRINRLRKKIEKKNRS